jgi:uncharacterized RDD family membrane protein YckC
MNEPITLPIASTQRRMVSFVIDDLVVSLFFIIIFYPQLSSVFSSVTEVNEMTLQSINAFISQNILVIFAIKIIYHAVLVWQNGMTVGKYIMKIKVIDLQTGQTPNFSKALLRASIRIPSEALFYLGFVLAFFLPLNQTLHDKLSNCVVVDG